jgi:predicted amidohydrolase
MEFGLSEALPIYSGGLGMLAGDHLKSASSQGVPLIGIGLLYQQGYFHQIIDDDGSQIPVYPYNEPGSLPVAIELPCGRVGLSICYDLRFPELYRALGTPSLILVPAAFTATTGAAHWHLLLRARAVENQCYVLAAAQGGLHPGGRRTYGHSTLVDPWGRVVAERPEGPGIVVGDVDPACLASVRAQLPALAHRTLRSGPTAPP